MALPVAHMSKSKQQQSKGTRASPTSRNKDLNLLQKDHIRRPNKNQVLSLA